MTELDKMKRAKLYLDKLSSGVNPLDDSTIPPGDLMNNPRLIRCFQYVSEVLEQAIATDGTFQHSKTHSPFAVAVSDRQNFAFSDEPIPLKELTQRINDLRSSEDVRRLPSTHIRNWLLETGLLEERPNENGTMKKYPTEAGLQMGIILEHRKNYYGEYDVLLYSREAQQLILDNLDSLPKRRSKRENDKAV